MATISSTLSMFHQPQLRIPLRSTKSVLDMIHLGEGTSSNNMAVALFDTGTPSYTIPPLLMPGLPGYKVRVVDKKNKEEVVTAVKTTREYLSKTRAGTKGVPVLYNAGDDDIYSWVMEGLAMADIPGVSMEQTCRVICYSGFYDEIPESNDVE